MKRPPIVTAAVLAGAYVGSPTKSRLTHAVQLDANGRYHRVLCDGVAVSHIADDMAMTPRELEPPTCPRCLSKLTRWNRHPHPGGRILGGAT